VSGNTDTWKPTGKYKIMSNLSLLDVIAEKTKFPELYMIGCEVGVWEGKTSAELLSRFHNLHLHMIDPWQSEGILGSMKCSKSPRFMNKVFRLAATNTEFAQQRRTIIRDTGTNAVTTFSDASLDFVFIDANHYYEHVKEDLNDWWPKLKPEGIFVGHDYNGKTDKKGIWGVKRAVDEFADNLNLEVEVYPELLWCIIKPETNK